MRIEINNNIDGSILDVGGGGEGIITRAFQKQVIAIDNRRDELDEAPEGSIKIVMDASDMLFTNCCFDNVTAFYSFMFISKSLHQKVFSEIKRVLKCNGCLHLWDSTIVDANPFITDIEVQIQDELVHTTYGIYKNDAMQNEKYFKDILEELDFELLCENVCGGHYYQKWLKR